MLNRSSNILNKARSLLSHQPLNLSPTVVSGVFAGPQRFYSTCSLSVEKKTMNAPQALTQFIRGGQRVFIQTGCGVPKHLIQNLECLVENKEQVFGEKVEKIDFAQLIIVYYPDQMPPYLLGKNRDYFHTTALFNGNVERYAISERQSHEDPLIDYMPMYLREGPRLVKSGNFPIDVALIQVSPPDEEGYW